MIKTETPKSKPKKAIGPGSYDPSKGHIIFRERRPQTALFGKGDQKKITFSDEAVRRKKFVPGVGYYKETEKGYKILSGLPLSIKTRRQ